MHKALTKAEYDQILRARVIGWGLRWTVGFGVVLVLTALVDGLGWLWPVVIGIAAISFILIIIQMNKMKLHVYEGGKEIEE
jgi:hypothetical protein